MATFPKMRKIGGLQEDSGCSLNVRFLGSTMKTHSTHIDRSICLSGKNQSVTRLNFFWWPFRE